MPDEATMETPSVAENILAEAAQPETATDAAPIAAEAATPTEAAPEPETATIDNVLGEESPKAEAAPETDAAKSEDAPNPEDEAYSQILEGLKDREDFVLGKDAFGKEVVLKTEDVKVLYPALKAAGVPASSAEGAVKAFAAFEGARLKRENEAAVKDINARAQECRDAFGADFGRVRRNAIRGLELMDGGLRDELLSTPVLVNDYRFLKFLAEIGEKFSVDDGTGAGASGGQSNGRYNPGSWVMTSNR